MARRLVAGLLATGRERIRAYRSVRPTPDPTPHPGPGDHHEATARWSRRWPPWRRAGP